MSVAKGQPWLSPCGAWCSPRGAVQGEIALCCFMSKPGNAWQPQWQGWDDNWNRKEKKFLCQPLPRSLWCVVQLGSSRKLPRLCNFPVQRLASALLPHLLPARSLSAEEIKDLSVGCLQVGSYPS